MKQNTFARKSVGIHGLVRNFSDLCVGRMRAPVGLLALATVVVIQSSAAASPHITAEQARQWTIFAPKPVYPESARTRRIQGSGYFKLIVRVKTGVLQRVVIIRSTGSSELDVAALQAFRQWRFKPRVLPSMRQLNPPSKEPNADKDACLLIPITFAL